LPQAATHVSVADKSAISIIVSKNYNPADYITRKNVKILHINMAEPGVGRSAAKAAIT